MIGAPKRSPLHCSWSVPQSPHASTSSSASSSPISGIGKRSTRISRGERSTAAVVSIARHAGTLRGACAQLHRMTTFPREEIEATLARYIKVREAIERGEADWPDLAQFFTDDAVYIDPAWGRV